VFGKEDINKKIITSEHLGVEIVSSQRFSQDNESTNDKDNIGNQIDINIDANVDIGLNKNESTKAKAQVDFSMPYGLNSVVETNANANAKSNTNGTSTIKNDNNGVGRHKEGKSNNEWFKEKAKLGRKNNMTKVTRQELAKHVIQADCWIAVNG